MGDQQGNGSREWRSRWAAIGAAVAVSLGAGGVFFADAASPPSSVVMVEPARILDTRDPVNVGLNGPFVSPIGQDLQVTGLIATTTGPATIVPGRRYRGHPERHRGCTVGERLPVGATRECTRSADHLESQLPGR